MSFQTPVSNSGGTVVVTGPGPPGGPGPRSPRLKVPGGGPGGGGPGGAGGLGGAPGVGVGSSPGAVNELARLGRSIALSVDMLATVGETIADENPEIRGDMLDACRDSRTASGKK